jgi:hypothetical protein
MRLVATPKIALSDVSPTEASRIMGLSRHAAPLKMGVESNEEFDRKIITVAAEADSDSTIEFISRLERAYEGTKN